MRPAKQPHIVWRVTRVFLHILGKILLWALVIAGTAALIIAIAGSIFMAEFSGYLKSDVIPKAHEYVETINFKQNESSFICYVDPSTGAVIDSQQIFAEENRIPVEYDAIPSNLINAAIAIEDKRFEEHDGVDWLRTLSAVKNFLGGDASYGASTITQQLIKNLSEEDDITINRKVQEIFRALALEQIYTEEEIMESYLNTIYLGGGCYGVQSASRYYFAKNVDELTAAECASIIAITNNPSLYNPYIYPENNRERQLIILNEMYEQGRLSGTEYETAKNQEMVFNNGLYTAESYHCESCGFDGVRSEYDENEGSYFCPNCGVENQEAGEYDCYSYFEDTVYRDVIRDLCAQYGWSEAAANQKLLTGGYRIYVTTDTKIQALVDEVYENLDNVPNTVSTQQLQSAIIVIENATGDIVAMAGGVGEKEGSLSLNRATQSELPTGSAIKPLSVYAPALEAGVVTPATAFEDSSFYDYQNWPQNSSRTYSGTCLVLRGVTSSLNTIAVKVLDKLGLEESYSFLTQKLGITTLVEKREIGGKEYTDIAYAPLALGELTWGMTVREVAQAYATFPNNGVFREARTYTYVEDAEGNVILKNSQESHIAMDEKTSYYMTGMLESAVQYGTGTPAYMSNMAVAGKTGTSNNNQTRWFAGYTPYYTAVVWCGYDQQEQIILSDSYTNPAIVMWNQVMRPIHEGLEKRSFSTYDGVYYYDICSDCGMLATDACRNDLRTGEDRVTSVRLHWSDTPYKECTCHTMVKICAASGKVANEHCEHAIGNTVTEQSRLIYNKDWRAKYDENWVYNPDDPDCFCSVHSAHSIVTPDDPDVPDPDQPDQPDQPDNPNDPENPDAPEDPSIPDEPTEHTAPTESALTTLPTEEDSWYRRRKIVSGQP